MPLKPHLIPSRGPPEVTPYLRRPVEVTIEGRGTISHARLTVTFATLRAAYSLVGSPSFSPWPAA